jgi:hypothetical protein
MALNVVWLCHYQAVPQLYDLNTSTLLHMPMLCKQRPQIGTPKLPVLSGKKNGVVLDCSSIASVTGA